MVFVHLVALFCQMVYDVSQNCHNHLSQASLHIHFKYRLEKLVVLAPLDFVKQPNIIGLSMILLLVGYVFLNLGPVI